jgi:hypothetical protein
VINDGCSHVWEKKMGSDEKAAQVGEAVTEYQAAKVACAHIDLKIRKVFDLYLSAGNSMDWKSDKTFEPTITGDGKLKLGLFVHPGPYPELLNESELTVLVIERDAARSRLDQARKTMESLGITSVS